MLAQPGLLSHARGIPAGSGHAWPATKYHATELIQNFWWMARRGPSGAVVGCLRRILISVEALNTFSSLPLGRRPFLTLLSFPKNGATLREREFLQPSGVWLPACAYSTRNSVPRSLTCQRSARNNYGLVLNDIGMKPVFSTSVSSQFGSCTRALEQATSIWGKQLAANSLLLEGRAEEFGETERFT